MAQPHEIGDGSATLRKGCGPSSPSVTSVLIRVGPRGCHPINGANNVALHLHTSNKSHDIWLVSPRHLRASVHPFVYFTAPQLPAPRHTYTHGHGHTHTHPLFLSLARIYSILVVIRAVVYLHKKKSSHVVRHRSIVTADPSPPETSLVRPPKHPTIPRCSRDPASRDSLYSSLAREFCFVQVSFDFVFSSLRFFPDSFCRTRSWRSCSFFSFS